MMAVRSGKHVALVGADHESRAVYDRKSLDTFARSVTREIKPGGQMDDVPRDFAAGYVYCLADILNGNMSIISPQGTIRRALGLYTGNDGKQGRVSVDGQ